MRDRAVHLVASFEWIAGHVVVSRWRLLQPRLVTPGSINTTGSYNHYSALRTYEDLLGLDYGGADHRGHLGFAATATSFGTDVFNREPGTRR